jgi:hypothetical protein
MEDIAIYHDGSGKASEQLEENLKTIRERMEVLKLLSLFIAKHQDVLAGSYWRVEYLDPEIKISPWYYRGKQASPATIAQLWPGSVWRRVKPRYSHLDNECRDWMATVDGVKLRIEGAEKVQVIRVKTPRDGVIVAQVPPSTAMDEQQQSLLTSSPTS